MTEKYYISTSPRVSGGHTIHRNGCPFLPDPGNRIPLGAFQSSKEAVRDGKGFFKRAERCPFCSKEHNETNIRAIPVKLIDPDLISPSGMQKTGWLEMMFCSLS